MAYWRKKRKDISDGIPFPRVPNPQQISAYIKKILKLNSAEFFELEPMEVEKTNLDGYTQGAILGKFINEPTQDIKGGVVLPLFPNPFIKNEITILIEYQAFIINLFFYIFKSLTFFTVS